MTTREPIPKSTCYACGAPLDGATAADGSEAKPKGGGTSISVCYYCGAVAIFGEDLVLSRPPKALLDKLFLDASFRREWLVAATVRSYALANPESPLAGAIVYRPEEERT